MKKFGYMRLFKDDVGIFHKLYFRMLGVSPDHQLRFMYFNKTIKNCIRGKEITNILDAGCGGGDYSLFLSEKYPNSNVRSIDVDSSGIERNREIIKKIGVKNINFECADITSLNGYMKYDFICCIDVLEHICNTREALSKLKESLNDNGFLYIHIPVKKERPMFFDKYLREFHDWAATEHTAEPLTNNDFIELVKAEGFNIVYQQSSFNHYLGELCVSLIMFFYQNNMVNKVILSLLSPIMVLLTKMDVAIKSKKGNALALLLEKSTDAHSV